MQQTLSENLEQFDKDLVTKLLEELSVERRLEGLSPGDRLRGLSPEEVVASLSDDEAARLRELLERKQSR